MTVDSTFDSFLVSTEIQCPLCDKPDWCLAKADHRGVIFWVLCGRTNEAPAGWERTGTSRDNRGIFRLEGTNHSRKIFPREVQLVWRTPQDGPCFSPVPVAEGESPGVGDRVIERHLNGRAEIKTFVAWGGQNKHGNGHNCQVRDENGVICFTTSKWVEPCREDPHTGDRELEIVYDYGPLHQVRRRQWSDRRPWYQGKSKQVRPWYGSERGDGPGLIWQEGRGSGPWPLYQEADAVEAINNGRLLFVCGGEPSVDALRSLGLYACCNSGGEARWLDLYQIIEPLYRKAREAQRNPIIVIWPDYDVAGEGTSAQLLKRLLDLGGRSVALDPPEVWAAMPAKGDPVDWIAAHPGEELDWYLAQIKSAVDKAIDRHEIAEVAKRRAKNWGAPINLRGELGYEQLRKVSVRGDDGRVVSEWQEVYTPVTNFDFKIERQIVGPQGAGYQLAVWTTTSTIERSARVWGDHLATAPNFRKQLSIEVGEALICRLKDEQFQALLMVRILEYRQKAGGKIYKLIDRIGRQPDGSWVFKDCQLTPDGKPTTEGNTGWSWNDALTDGETAFKSPAVGAHNPQAIRDLAAAAKRFFGDNWPICLLTFGYVAAGCHYEPIMQAEDSFPILNLYGDAGTGKTLTATTALSLIGQHRSGLMAAVSVSAAYERLQGAGGLAHCLDDPQRDDNLSDFFKALYNAKSRVVRGRDGKKFASQTPRSPLFFSSNMALGSDHQAARSRLIKISVPEIKGGDKSAYPALEAARDAASGCFPDLIRMTYDPAEVKRIEAQIRPSLALAHDRIPRSFALLLSYASKVAALIDDKTDLIAWCKEHCFPLLNSGDEAGDSLIDFVEKARAMEIQGDVGPWNMRLIDKLGARCLAINLASVWPIVDRAHKLPYDLGNLRAVIGQRGGNLKGAQRFHCDRVSSIKEGQKTKMVTQRCVEIPVDLLEKGGVFFGDNVFECNSVNEGPGEVSNPYDWSDSAVTQTCNRTEEIVNRFTQIEAGLLEPEKPVSNSMLPVYTVTSGCNESVTAETLAPEPIQPPVYTVDTVTRKNTIEQKSSKQPKSPKAQKTPGFSVGDRALLFDRGKSCPVTISRLVGSPVAGAWYLLTGESVERYAPIHELKAEVSHG